MESILHIKVFSDLRGLELIFTDHVEDELEDEAYDLRDGEDFYEAILADIEEKFGDGWSLAVLYHDRHVGRCFTRREFILRDSDFNYVGNLGQRLYLFGCDDLEATSSAFFGSLCYEINFAESAPWVFHIKGRDENVIKALTGFFPATGYAWTSALVIRNPTEKSKLAWLALQGSYQKAIWIDGDKDLTEIEYLRRTLEVGRRVQTGLNTPLEFIKAYGLKQLEFVNQFASQLVQQQDSVVTEFERRFSV